MLIFCRARPADLSRIPLATQMSAAALDKTRPPGSSSVARSAQRLEPVFVGESVVEWVGLEWFRAAVAGCGVGGRSGKPHATLQTVGSTRRVNGPRSTRVGLGRRWIDGG